MNRSAVLRVVYVLAVALAFVGRATAQTEVGTFAAAVGVPQVHRGGNWEDGSIGGPVFAGDRIRTGPSGAAKLVMADDSLLDIGPGTEVSVETLSDPAARRFRTQLHVTQGKIRARVSENYRTPKARFEVETPTAIADVRGTDFIVLYDAASERTDIVGIAGEVEVVGTLGAIGGTVQVGPHALSQVQKGRFPTAPQRLAEPQYAEYLEGVNIVGTGHRDGLSAVHPVLTGHVLAPQDVPGAPQTQAGAEGLTVGPPQEFLADRLSADVRTNTQPLIDFELTPPGQVPSGNLNVTVGY